MVRLYNEASGQELGTISDEELRFLQDQLEEESLEDRDYWINPATVEMLASRGGSQHLLTVLRNAVGDSEEGIDILFEREGEGRQRLRR